MTPWKKKTLPIWQEVSCVSRETNISPFFQACLKMGYHPRWDMSVVSWRVSPWDRPPHRPTREAKSVPLWGLGRWSRWRDLRSKVEDWNPGETPRKIEMDGKKCFFGLQFGDFLMLQPLIFRGCTRWTWQSKKWTADVKHTSSKMDWQNCSTWCSDKSSAWCPISSAPCVLNKASRDSNHSSVSCGREQRVSFTRWKKDIGSNVDDVQMYSENV